MPGLSPRSPYGKLQPYVDEAPEKLGAQLKDYAPKAFKYAEDQALQAPTIGAAYVRDALMAKTTEILDEAEPKITKAISDAISQVKESSNRAGFDGKDPAQVDKLVEQLVHQVGTDAQKTMDKVYSDYSQEADQLLKHLDQLADGNHLDALEEHHRQIIISFLALAQKWKTEPPQLMALPPNETATPDDEAMHPGHGP